jgi:outer membrane protein
MKKIATAALAAAFAAAMLAPVPAMAGSADGKFQVKLLGTGVLPDGKIVNVEKDLIGLPAGSQTKANDNVVPTVAIEYFFSPNISVETICCLTQHHINGDGAIAGTRIVDHVLVLPATATVKFHLPLEGGIKPYIGAGPSVFFYIDEKPGSTTRALGGTDLNLDNKLGFALQAGIDVPVNANGLGVSLDAKKYFMDTKLHVRNAAGTEVLTTKHSLDPWVVSAGLSYRF